MPVSQRFSLHPIVLHRKFLICSKLLNHSVSKSSHKFLLRWKLWRKKGHHFPRALCFLFQCQRQKDRSAKNTEFWQTCAQRVRGESKQQMLRIPWSLHVSYSPPMASQQVWRPKKKLTTRATSTDKIFVRGKLASRIISWCRNGASFATHFLHDPGQTSDSSRFRGVSGIPFGTLSLCRNFAIPLW